MCHGFLKCLGSIPRLLDRESPKGEPRLPQFADVRRIVYDQHTLRASRLSTVHGGSRCKIADVMAA
jgi:hypothetical protein